MTSVNVNTPPAPEVTDCLPMMPTLTPERLPRIVPVTEIVVLVTDSVAACCVAPAVPVTVMLVVAGAEPPAIAIAAWLVDALAGMGFGLNAAETLAPSPLALSMMSPTAPVRCTVTVTVPDPAIGSVNDVGSVVIVKSPGGTSSSPPPPLSPLGGPPTDPHATTTRAPAHFAIHPGEDIVQPEYASKHAASTDSSVAVHFATCTTRGAIYRSPRQIWRSCPRLPRRSQGSTLAIASGSVRARAVASTSHAPRPLGLSL